MHIKILSNFTGHLHQLLSNVNLEAFLKHPNNDFSPKQEPDV
jgi:hypothetical protein